MYRESVLFIRVAGTRVLGGGAPRLLMAFVRGGLALR
jgi:hypothetical protein